jgi:hypothetical protein
VTFFCAPADIKNGGTKLQAVVGSGDINGSCLKNMVGAIGFETTTKCRFNNMQGHGWHRSTRKAVVVQQTDRRWIAGSLIDTRPSTPLETLNVRS